MSPVLAVLPVPICPSRILLCTVLSLSAVPLYLLSPVAAVPFPLSLCGNSYGASGTHIIETLENHDFSYTVLAKLKVKVKESKTSQAF